MKVQRYYLNELPNGGAEILADDSGDLCKWDDVEALIESRPSWPPSVEEVRDWLWARYPNATSAWTEHDQIEDVALVLDALDRWITPPAPEAPSEEIRALLLDCEGFASHMSSIFNNPNFTDRYGDGDLSGRILAKIRAALAHPAVRASAREAGEVSEEELDAFLLEEDLWISGEYDDIKKTIRAALAHFAPPRGRCDCEIQDHP